MKKLMKDKRGFVFTVGFVLACGLALLIFLGLASGGLGALWKIGKTTSGVVNIIGSIPSIVWVFIGFFFLISLMRGRRRRR